MSVGTSMQINRLGTAAAGTTAIEYGLGGKKRQTELFVAATTVIGAVADTAAMSRGVLLYTFPAGTIVIQNVYGDIGLDVDETNYDEDTPEVGLGTTTKDGSAEATLGASVATTEDIWGPHVVAGCDANAVAADAIQAVNGTGQTVEGVVIAAGGVHTVYLNIADTWANGTGTPNVVVGSPGARFIIEWLDMELEGV